MVTMSSLAIVIGAGILLLGEKEVPIVARNAGRLAGSAMRLIRTARSTVDTLTAQPGLNDMSRDLKKSLGELNRVRSDFREGLAPRASGFLSEQDMRPVDESSRSPAAAVAARRAAGSESGVRQDASMDDGGSSDGRTAGNAGERDSGEADDGLRQLARPNAARGAAPHAATAATGSSLTSGIHRARRKKQ